MQGLMDKVVAQYRRQVQLERENRRLADLKAQVVRIEPEEEDFLTYILKPMNLEMTYEHETDAPTKAMKFTI